MSITCDEIHIQKESLEAGRLPAVTKVSNLVAHHSATNRRASGNTRNVGNVTFPMSMRNSSQERRKGLKNVETTPFFSRQPDESPRNCSQKLNSAEKCREFNQDLLEKQKQPIDEVKTDSMTLPFVQVYTRSAGEPKSPLAGFTGHSTPKLIRSSAVDEVEALETQDYNPNIIDKNSLSGGHRRKSNFSTDVKAVDKARLPTSEKRDQLGKALTPLKNQNSDQKAQEVNAIYCQSSNMEAYFKRCIRRIGWIEVDNPLHAMNRSQYNSGFPTMHRTNNLHIRFNISDTEGTDLGPNQHYNHFPANREFTTKGGLCKNLWHSGYTEAELQISHMFPRCYDLSNEQQTVDFTVDFNQTAITSILSLVTGSFIENETVRTLVQELTTAKEKFTCATVFKAYFKQKCLKQDNKNSQLNEALKLTYMFCKELCDRKTGAQVDKRTKRKPFPQSKEQTLVDWHAQLIHKRSLLASLKDAPTYFKVKLVYLQQKIRAEFPQHRQIDGLSNVWIVKPSYNARGLGIYCTRSMKEIMPSGKKSQQKVVQKYIEKPFTVDKRKFDFRQWVLVNSWEPLDVSVFQTAYLKLCGSTFDLGQLNDTFRHLSNFSLQKKGEIEDQQDLTMSTEQFELFLNKNESGKFSWERDMLPKIQDVVWRSLKSVQETQEQKSNCFEIYGFDIVLDRDFNPWVIEINLSPACAERTEWLSKMLEDSTLDMLGHLEQRILLMNPTDWPGLKEMQVKREKANKYHERLKLTKYLNEESFYEEHNINNRWIRLEESIQEIKEYSKSQAHLNLIKEKNLNLEVIPNKFNHRHEKQFEKSYRKEESAKFIQRVWLGCKGRTVARNLRQKYASTSIQRQVRVFLAKLELTRRRQNKAATGIQKHLRTILARSLANRIRSYNILTAQTFVALRLQSHFRRKRDKKSVRTVRECTRALQLQKLCRGYLSRKQSLRERTYKCQVTLIQKFYKRRHKRQQKASQLLQKIMKGYNSYKKTQQLLYLYKVSFMTADIRHKLLKRQVFDQMKQVKAVTKIATWYRCLKGRNTYVRLIKAMAREKLARMFRKNTIKKIQLMARNYRIGLARRVRLLQSVMKGYLARKRVKLIQTKHQLDGQAIMVQKYLRGYLVQQELEQMRVEIGASIMIQACWKGYQVRQTIKFARAQMVFSRKKQERVDQQKSFSLRAQRGLAIFNPQGKPVSKKKQAPPADRDQSISQKLHQMRSNFLRDTQSTQQSLIQRRIEYLKNVTNALGESENKTMEDFSNKSKENRTSLGHARGNVQNECMPPISPKSTDDQQNLILQKVLHRQASAEKDKPLKTITSEETYKCMPHTASYESNQLPAKFIKQQDQGKCQRKSSSKNLRDSDDRRRKSKSSANDHLSSQKVQSVGSHRVGIKRKEAPAQQSFAEKDQMKRSGQGVRDVYSQHVQRFASTKPESLTSLNKSQQNLIVAPNTAIPLIQPPQTTKQPAALARSPQHDMHHSHTPMANPNKLKIHAVNQAHKQQATWMLNAQKICDDIQKNEENLIFTGSPREDQQVEYGEQPDAVEAQYSTYETIPNEGGPNRKYFNAAVKAYNKSLERDPNPASKMRSSGCNKYETNNAKKMRLNNRSPDKPAVLNTTFMDGEFDSLSNRTRQAYMQAAAKQAKQSKKAQQTSTNMPLVSTAQQKSRRLLSASSSRASVELRKSVATREVARNRGSSVMRDIAQQLDIGESGKHTRVSSSIPGQGSQNRDTQSRQEEGLPEIPSGRMTQPSGHNPVKHYFNASDEVGHIVNQTPSSFARSFETHKHLSAQQQSANMKNYKNAVAAFKKTSTSFVENIQKQQKAKAEVVRSNIQQTTYTKMLKVPPVLQQQQQQILTLKKQKSGSQNPKMKKMSSIAQAKMIIL